ncbi:MAG: transcriptional regulator NrdR [Chloroflexota bacterium]|nr:transcriptional regulator NrdR [Chloroflexota bacterium]
MRCPYCDSDDTRVIDTRHSGNSIRRRRECQSCGRRFTTYERAVLNAPQVVKRDGRREDWDFNKLLGGLRTACAKLPIASEAIERLAREVEVEVIDLGQQEVESEEIGSRVLEKLRDLDKVAYIRFASVHLPLADLEALKQEMDRLLEQR